MTGPPDVWSAPRLRAALSPMSQTVRKTAPSARKTAPYVRKTAWSARKTARSARNTASSNATHLYDLKVLGVWRPEP